MTETAQIIAKQITKCLKDGGKLLIIGNGGSSTMASHMAAEFVCGIDREKGPGYRAMSCSDQAILTAWSNDVDFVDVFRRWVEVWGDKGDILLLLSTSGRSINVLEAAAQAKKQGLLVIDFPRTQGDACIIQNYQLTLMHSICRLVFNAL